MNKVFLIGRLSRDPELRHTGSGTAVCQINVAISRPVAQGSEPQTDFINVVVWNKQAENVARYLSKGRQIAIEGRIQTRNYDGQDGRKVYVTEVVADNVEFIGSRNSSGNSNNMSSPASYNAGPSPYDFGGAPEPKGQDVDSNPFADFGASIEISDDELPF